MEAAMQRIEGTYRSEISLLKELLNCVILETDSLVNLNIENLWPLMEEKKRLLGAIDDIRGEIKNLTGKDNQVYGDSLSEKRQIAEFSRRVADLKGEIRIRVIENASFIRESLDFFDEVISILATCGRTEDAYGPIGNKQKELSPLIYHKEV